MVNPYESPAILDEKDPTRERVDAQKRLRRVLMIGMYVLVAAWEIVQVSRPSAGMVLLLLTLTTASVATYVCVVDSRMRGRPIVQSVQWIMFFTWPLAVPIYLIHSRRLRGVAITMLHGVGLFITASIALNLAAYAIYGNLWLRRFGM
jgi:hypothetical protein